MTAPAEHERVREEGLDSGAYLITCSCGEKYATDVWKDEHAAVLAAHAQHVAAAGEVERLWVAQPIGFQALHEAHHSIGQTVDRYRRGVITAEEAMAEIHEQVGDETDRTAERDAEETR